MSSPFEPSLLYEKRDFFTHGFIGIDQITTKVHHRVQVKKKTFIIMHFHYKVILVGETLNLDLFSGKDGF